MKKRILSLIMIMPIIVMLLTFGFSRTVQLTIDLEAEDIIWDYQAEEAFEFSASEWESGVELDAQLFPNVDKEIKWSVKGVMEYDGSEANEETPIARIEDGKLYKNRDGVVVITAYANDKVQKAFTAYLIDTKPNATSPAFVIVRGTDTKETCISDERYFGLYNLNEGEKKSAQETFTVQVLPSSGNYTVNASFVEDTDCAMVLEPQMNEDGTYTVKVNLEKATEEKLTLKVNAKGVNDNVGKTNNSMEFGIVDGVNVRSYDDLLYCTNPLTYCKIVLRTNLESEKNLVRKNSALFGKKVGDKVVCEPTTVGMKSTYDTKYYDYSKISDEATINVGITFRDDVYGNGYTINAHELAYPSNVMEITDEKGNVIETAAPAESDPFKGPLLFVSSLGCSCYGQDNIGFLVEGDNITIDNITLKNCNNVSDLSNLDWVGTVLEVYGDNVTVKNSQIMNGRTVVRSMSNKNLTIEKCLLSYAREFIFKLGSNKFEYARQGITLKNDASDHADLAPSSVIVDGETWTFDEIANNTANNNLCDSTATVKDTYFHTSGVFCIGLDTHFAGPLLYNTSHVGNTVLAATSWPSRLSLEGDVRFYDWKSVDGLDSSTLISVDTSAGDGRDFSNLFDIAQLIEDYVATNKDVDIILDKGGKHYVHGGIAFFGGGANYSKINFTKLNEECKEPFGNVNNPMKIGLDDKGLGLTSNILVRAAGYGKFKFHMYSPDYTDITVGSLPKLSDIKNISDQTDYE